MIVATETAANVGGPDRRRVGCPKRMVFGPCGGVRPGGGCEVDERMCVFLDEPAPRWPAADVADRTMLDAPAQFAGGHPIVVCDARPSEPTLAAARDLFVSYAGWCDAILLGEHHDRVDLPNSLLAGVALDAGVRPWVTMSCRDRNEVGLEAEVAACAEIGVTEMHCVTGDARAPHIRPETTQVFDLDSLRLTALARSFGLTVSVAESPSVPPVDRRPTRAADKWNAGASWCFVNVGIEPAGLASFIDRSREEGSRLHHIACVPVFTDELGAERLAALPGVAIEAAGVRQVLQAPDPVQAGIDRAVAVAESMLAIDGVEGVNLSGLASSTSPAARLSVVRRVAERLRTIPAASTSGGRP